MLEEGLDYNFKIIKKTNLDDSVDFWILEAPSGKRYFLDVSEYRHYYNIKEGCDIKCRVDKINCTGKVFLEPENPLYKEGKSYLFTVKFISGSINIFGEKASRVLITDKFGNENICECNHNKLHLSANSEIELYVSRIKKGKLILVDPEIKEMYSIQERSIYTEFSITGNTIDSAGNQCYIVTDNLGLKYVLNKSIYSNYNLSPENKFLAKRTDYNEYGILNIEPTHPHYEEGKYYLFRFLRLVHKNKTEEVFMVSDIYENELFAPIKEGLVPMPNENIGYIVQNIRNGKPILRNK